MGPGQALLRAGRGAGPLSRVLRRAGRSRSPNGSRGSTPTESQHPEQAALLQTHRRGRRCPTAGMPSCPASSADDDALATRKASEQAIQWAAGRVPHLIGGSADLASSTNTDIDDSGRRDRRRLQRAQPRLRGSRARDGRGRQRAGPPRLPRVRRHVPDVLGLHEGRGAALGADEAAVDLGLHARLDRSR